MNGFYCLFLFLVFSSCSYVNEYFGFDDDNIIEELIEESLKDYSGFDVDLTPNTEE